MCAFNQPHYVLLNKLQNGLNGIIIRINIKIQGTSEKMGNRIRYVELKIGSRVAFYLIYQTIHPG